MLTLSGQPATVERVIELITEYQAKVRALVAVLELLTRPPAVKEAPFERPPNAPKPRAAWAPTAPKPAPKKRKRKARR